MRSINRTILRVVVVLAAAGIGFAGGFVFRGNRAASEASLSVLMSCFARAAQDRYVLVMLAKGRAGELGISSERRLGDDLLAARQAFADSQPLLDSALRRYPWLITNLATEFRRSGEYLARSGSNSDAVRSADWTTRHLDSLVRE